MKVLPPAAAWRCRILPRPPGAARARLVGVGDGFLLVMAPNLARLEKPWLLHEATGTFSKAPTSEKRVVSAAGGRWLTGSAAADDHSALACAWLVQDDEEPAWSMLHEDGWSTSHAAAASSLGICGRAWPVGARGASAALWREMGAPPFLFGGADEHAQLFASSGAEHVGDAYVVGAGRAQAALWRGDEASTVSLAPAGAWTSSARGVADGVQVGVAWMGEARRARPALWRGDAASFADLGALGAAQGVTRACAAGVQVGVVTASEERWTSVGMTPRVGARATAWAGSAASALDLHAALGDAGVGAVRSDVTGLRVGERGVTVFGTRWAMDAQGVEQPEAVVWEVEP